MCKHDDICRSRPIPKNSSKYFRKLSDSVVDSKYVVINQKINNI